jgi:hypothetical protein
LPIVSDLAAADHAVRMVRDPDLKDACSTVEYLVRLAAPTAAQIRAEIKPGPIVVDGSRRCVRYHRPQIRCVRERSRSDSGGSKAGREDNTAHDRLLHLPSHFQKRIIKSLLSPDIVAHKQSRSSVVSLRNEKRKRRRPYSPTNFWARYPNRPDLKARSCSWGSHAPIKWASPRRLRVKVGISTKATASALDQQASIPITP